MDKQNAIGKPNGFKIEEDSAVGEPDSLKMYKDHVPVMLRECIEGLNIKSDGIYVDGTLGRAGHSMEIAKRLESGTLIAVDRDETAIEAGRNALKPFGDRVKLVRGNFRDIDAILDSLNIEFVDGMLFDFGVSSPQLDESERGFSYMADSPLDMRMDRNQSLTAYEIVNEWPENELKKILYEYGEERYALSIVRSISARRNEKPIESTHELVDAIKGGMPGAALREKQHPAKRTFQAIRIAVNDELRAISDLFDAAVPRLAKGGRIAVISFHSLEDRIVKNAVAAREKGCTCPKDFPVCICGFVPSLKRVTKRAISPGADEISVNPRARSAKLRIAEKL